jgi:hypothetical protein
MIPVEKGAAQKSPCNTPSYCDCSLYKERNAPERDVERIRGFLLKTDCFFHPRHVWLATGAESEHEARLGIDDFAQQLLGPLDRVSVPPEGTAVKENGVCSTRSTKRSWRTRRWSTTTRTGRGGSCRCT